MTTYAVSRRTREIRVRIALGASRRDVMQLLLRQGGILAGAGVLFGLVLAAVGSRVIAGLLQGVNGLDPLTFAGASVLLATVALFATYLPARRALAVDPMVALRNE